jgi:Uma2 family endonuclease
MSTHTKHVTADELLGMPDDGVRRELVAGELREMAPAGHEHGRIAMRFSAPLGVYVEEHGLGAVYAAETGFLIARDPDTVRGPDVAFVGRERLALAERGRSYFPGAPDLSVEVVSPGDSYTEVEAKVEEWLGAGCQMVVVVNPRNRSLKVYRSQTAVSILTVGDSFDGADVIPGFALPLTRIFVE